MMPSYHAEKFKATVDMEGRTATVIIFSMKDGVPDIELKYNILKLSKGMQPAGEEYVNELWRRHTETEQD